MPKHTNSGEPYPTCPHCGLPIRRQDRFCRHCGTALASTRMGTQRLWPWAVGGLAVLGLSAWALFGVHGEPHPLASASHGGKAADRPPLLVTPQAVYHAHAVTTVSALPTSTITTPHTWPRITEPYRGDEISLRLPPSWHATVTSTPGQWAWNGPHGTGHVTMTVVAYKPTTAGEALGPQTFGTPIVTQDQTVAQTLYVAWPQQGWLAVAMVVSSNHIAWLGEMGQSIRVG